ncbi:hypothetical protein GXP67_05165 [Rhodocytophaga rosea]|uniref:Uncharacterized protein n=1 Tax=Rhodocytophaga rosea TaxID=2704465 RepID=A0A6C0GEK4_9BACT|nr:hypothetical protein [Rhodocytophaga rosea]QHT66100.1 hypothetical protein GXP67_05165 [Rhodocytophaga rosea]
MIVAAIRLCNKLSICYLLFIFIGCQSKKDKMIHYSKESILAELDSAKVSDPYKFFPDLGHGYFYLAGSRINLFADSTCWAIVFEKTGYLNRGLVVAIELTYFGNCLSNLDKAGLDNRFTCNTKWVDLISGEELDRISDSFELVSNLAKTVKVRNTDIAIEHNLVNYRNKGIEIREDDNPEDLIDFVALIRYLDEENVELFRATDEELHICLPKDLPKLMSIDQWHHKEYTYYENEMIGTKPSEYETFQMIADILVTSNKSKWEPTLESNNHWKNWPQAGNL